MSKDTPHYLNQTLKQWTKKLRSKDALERRLAAYALSTMGEEAKEAVEDLEKALEDKEDFVRIWAAGSLAIVDPGNKKAIDALTKGMDEDRGFVRSLAAWQLSRLHCDAAINVDKALPKLEKLLDDEDLSVQLEADLAWKRIHSRQHLTH